MVCFHFVQIREEQSEIGPIGSSFPENRLTIPEKFPNIYIDITGEEEEQYADFSVPRERAEGGRSLRKTAEPALEPLCQNGKYPCGTARTRR